MEFVDKNKYKTNIGIYKIFNLVNNKVYVGQTRENFQQRYWFHNWALKNNCHSNMYLQNDWNEYGENNFLFEVIEILDKKDLDEREKYWISYYREKDECYCLQDGGISCDFNKFISPESRKKVGEKNRQRMLGTHLSEETKIKMSNSRKGKHYPKKTNVLDEEKARIVKERLIQGYTPKEIMMELNIPYKPINGIISNNTWAHVQVEGWKDFQRNRPKGKGISSVGRKSKPERKNNSEK